MLKAVIFDMDGVIIDSEPLHARAAVMAADKFGIRLSIEECYQFIGSTTRFMFETLIDNYNLTVSVDELLQGNDEAKIKLRKEEGYQAIPGVKDLIIELYKQGVKLAIASSSNLNDIKAVVKALGIAKYFDKLISGTTVKHPKPSPDIFIKALKELGMNPKECIVIEDSMNGSIAAYEAGIPCIGYINPNSGMQDLSKASVLVEHFDSLSYQYLTDELKRANGEPITIATTKRLIIRELTVSDIKDMYQIYQNPEITRYMDDLNDYLDIEMEKHEAYIKNVYGFYGYGLWGVFSRETKKLIGRSGIQNEIIDGKEEIELSYLLDVDHWGYGYALECTKAILAYAQTELGIHRIVAIMDKLNERSIKLAERLGMQKEKEIVYKDRNCYLYSISLSSRHTPDEKGIIASQKVLNDFQLEPEEIVYSKRF